MILMVSHGTDWDSKKYFGFFFFKFPQKGLFSQIKDRAVTLTLLLKRGKAVLLKVGDNQI